MFIQLVISFFLLIHIFSPLSVSPFSLCLLSSSLFSLSLLTPTPLSLIFLSKQVLGYRLKLEISLKFLVEYKVHADDAFSFIQNPGSSEMLIILPKLSQLNGRNWNQTYFIYLCL